jgi:hypothetical protein
MKKVRRSKPFGVIINIYMEISQGNSCAATSMSNKQKCHFSSFFLYKIGEQEDRTGPAQRGMVTVGGGGKGK